MRTILCFGDSNTWGYEPGTGQRHARKVRWPGVLQVELGEDFYVVEEGLKGRTTAMDDPSRVARNGLTYLRPCLDSHAPLDLVVLLLGINDLKYRFGLSAYDVAQNLTMLVTVIQQTPCGAGGKSPSLLLVSPPHVGPLTAFADLYGGAEEKSRQLAKHYQAVAEQAGCHFLDAAEVVTSSTVDGVHWDADQHGRFGVRMAEVVRRLLGS